MYYRATICPKSRTHDFQGKVKLGLLSSTSYLLLQLHGLHFQYSMTDSEPVLQFLGPFLIQQQTFTCRKEGKGREGEGREDFQCSLTDSQGNSIRKLARCQKLLLLLVFYFCCCFAHAWSFCFLFR